MGICPKVLFSSTRQMLYELFPKYQQVFDVTLQTDASFTTHQYRAKLWGMLYIFSTHESHDAAAKKMPLLLLMMMAVVVVVIVEM